jgi:pimeloyl-ACP methyl ester carboxylesterase
MPWPFRGSIAVKEATIDAHAFGPPPSDKPTLVFLHEGLGSVAMWRGFPEALAERAGWGGFAFSRPGYGASSPAVLPRRTTYMHEDAALLPELFETAAISDPVLVGHSDGASIALIYAASNAEPRPRALLLEAPHVFVEQLGVDSIAQARDAFRTTDLPARLQRYHTLPVSHVFCGWNDIWLDPDFAAWNIEGVLSKITAPTLIVQGEQDEYGTWAQVTAVERGIRAPVTSVRLSECGHSPHKDQREATLDVMTAFLRRMSPRDRLRPTPE